MKESIYIIIYIQKHLTKLIHVSVRDVPIIEDNNMFCIKDTIWLLTPLIYIYISTKNATHVQFID